MLLVVVCLAVSDRRPNDPLHNLHLATFRKGMESLRRRGDQLDGLSLHLQNLRSDRMIAAIVCGQLEEGRCRAGSIKTQREESSGAIAEVEHMKGLLLVGDDGRRGRMSKIDGWGGVGGRGEVMLREELQPIEREIQNYYFLFQKVDNPPPTPMYLCALGKIALGQVQDELLLLMSLLLLHVRDAQRVHSNVLG